MKRMEALFNDLLASQAVANTAAQVLVHVDDFLEMMSRCFHYHYRKWTMPGPNEVLYKIVGIGRGACFVSFKLPPWSAKLVG
ncbi:hypothetical protein N7474_001204 [Penicillium riverlandense]|uniref:uncharacterized protein n=1 Tax=Penicillium riverlandense TaxID=1903569 RepID=UPI002548D79A|nr:uncharacterized protein N7474_001204 [Penicillium riverlandense]KAJ5832893.1 hypothetical protein N7474_001204 [Penicillium riverlandense]